MKYQIIVSDGVPEELAHHADFVGQVSQAAAEKLFSAFRTAVNSLESMPDRCPYFKAHKRYRYLMFEKRYAIIFEISGAVIYIDHLIDLRQEYDWLF